MLLNFSSQRIRQRYFHTKPMSKRLIPPRRFVKPSFEALIEKKRDGGEFTQEEIRYIIDSTIDGEMPQHQLAALWHMPSSDYLMVPFARASTPRGACR